MNHSPTVSVIIPNYNHAVYLKQRIDSVLNQTYPDLEVIILDDCSTDNSRSIIESYRNEIKVSHIVYNELNSGNTFVQWNKGIELAKGEYIWIAESDDWCEKNLLETLVNGLDQNPDCIISYCQSYCVNDDLNIKFQSNHTKLVDLINGKDFISKYIMLRNPIFNASMAVWRKNAYEKIDKHYMDFKLSGDYYFWIALCAFGNVFISGKLLNYFRQHDKNVSFTAAKNGLSIKEQVIILKDLADRKIITTADYNTGLKKLYITFKLLKKNLVKEIATELNKLFKINSESKHKLDLYFLQKSMQSTLRKLIHI